MLKLSALVFVALVLAVSHGLAIGGVGGYTDRPELLEDATVQSVAAFAVEQLAQTQNLSLRRMKLTRVQTQVVAGVNYKLEFTAPIGPLIAGRLSSCEVTVYARFDGTKTISDVRCR